MATVTLLGAFINSTTQAGQAGLTDVTVNVTIGGVAVVAGAAATESTPAGIYSYALTYDPVADADKTVAFNFNTTSSAVTSKVCYGGFTIADVGGEAQVQRGMTAQGYSTLRATYLDASISSIIAIVDADEYQDTLGLY